MRSENDPGKKGFVQKRRQRIARRDAEFVAFVDGKLVEDKADIATFSPDQLSDARKDFVRQDLSGMREFEEGIAAALRFRAIRRIGRHEAGQEELRKKEELAFLNASGAIIAITQVAQELSANENGLKLGVAKTSADLPMDIVLSWNEYQPDEGNPDLWAWKAIIIGVTVDEGQQKLTLNGEIIPAYADDLKTVFEDSISNPKPREYQFPKVSSAIEADQVPNKQFFASERQMKGRSKIKIRRPQRIPQ